jgi:hypothetical protein
VFGHAPAEADACEHIMVWRGFVRLSIPGLLPYQRGVSLLLRRDGRPWFGSTPQILSGSGSGHEILRNRDGQEANA